MAWDERTITAYTCPGKADVVGEAAAAGDEAQVLTAADRLSDVAPSGLSSMYASPAILVVRGGSTIYVCEPCAKQRIRHIAAARLKNYRFAGQRHKSRIMNDSM
jgi:hypothetical protein